jgi:hypothetical protein
MSSPTLELFFEDRRLRMIPMTICSKMLRWMEDISLVLVVREIKKEIERMTTHGAHVLYPQREQAGGVSLLEELP